MPHGLTIDEHDNVWLTDAALQQIYKFSNDGHLLLARGERGVAGSDPDHFDRPTAVAVAHDGSFYVSDGYRNTRVMKFSSTGDFLFQWGTKGTGPAQFDLPHWVALDGAGNVYVADRENARVQIFNSSGAYLTQWKSPILVDRMQLHSIVTARHMLSMVTNKPHRRTGLRGL
jgi:peptidylamidoglycolate lyase